MTSSGPLAALDLLADAAGSPVAPHVAARLDRLLASDATALAQTATVLRPEHLAGNALLPDPLPAVPALRVAASSADLDPGARRLLLTAAVAVTDRVDLLLEAADVAAETLFDPAVEAALDLHDGRCGRLDPALRAVVHDDADLAARTAAHASLARVAGQADAPDAALWHAALSTLAGDRAFAPPLLELAERLAARGDLDAAVEVGREATSQGAGEDRARGFLVAGRAALWGGYLLDAEELLHRAVSAGVPDVRTSADRGLRLVRQLTAADEGPVPARPGAAMSAAVDELVGHAPTAVDRAALRATAAALELLDSDAVAADRALVPVVVASRRARCRPAPWPSDVGALSPLAEAHLRVVQVLVLLCRGDLRSAAAVADDAVLRLPVATVLGGVIVPVLRWIEQHGPVGGSIRSDVLGQVGTPDPRWAGAVAELAERAAAHQPDRAPVLLAAAVGAASSVPGAEPGAGTDGPSARTDGGQAGLPLSWSAALTTREADVAELVVQGLSNREVAGRLCVSVRTVEVHLSRVFRKIAVHSRSELTAAAWQASGV